MPFQAAGEPGLTGKPNRQLNRLWHWLQEKDGFGERERGSAQGMGALDRGGHIEMPQCDPWFSLGGAQLGGQDRPAGVGGQLTLLAPSETMTRGHIFKLLIMYCPLGIFVLLVATCFKSYRKYLSAGFSQHSAHRKRHLLATLLYESTLFPSKLHSYTLLFGLLIFSPSLFCLYFISPGWLHLHVG